LEPPLGSGRDFRNSRRVHETPSQNIEFTECADDRAATFRNDLRCLLNLRCNGDGNPLGSMGMGEKYEIYESLDEIVRMCVVWNGLRSVF
jgi:hypothetical protein